MSNQDSENYLLVRWLFLRLLGLVYFSAFASLSLQILGLIGKDGIIPAETYLQVVRVHFGTNAYFLLPSLAWFNASNQALLGACYAGTFLSLLVVFGVMTGPALAILGILWLSLVTIGGDFFSFQSDGLLVETTCASLLFAPWSILEPPWRTKAILNLAPKPGKESLWLLRILLFRLMFASGLVKLISADPTWRDLSALAHHWETQPIPTALAWYLFQLPLWSQKFMTVAVFVCELVAPCLLFAQRRLRLAGCTLIFLLQFLIEATGNYTFLNILTMALCIPCLDDQVLERFFPEWLKARIEASCKKVTQVVWTARTGAVIATILIIFGLSRLGATFLGPEILPQPVAQTLNILSRWRLSNAYGMFAVMTTKRPEIIFEGSQDGKTWLAYEFPVKPGALDEIPGFVAPHMPRLDWRLWFAAMEPWQANPWVATFVERLLAGEPSVLSLLKSNPFPDKPPRFIRTYVYDYHFTSFSDKSKNGNWWWRDNKRDYLPVLSLSDFMGRP